jgi:large subunit ribosomal protein L22
VGTATAPVPAVSATAKHVRCSARKARLVADLIRGKKVDDALAILAYSTRSAATPVRKVLQSAAANADHNAGLDVRDLVLARVTVDEGPTIKRFRPRAQGRATPIMKRTCHITIGLAAGTR